MLGSARASRAVFGALAEDLSDVHNLRALPRWRVSTRRGLQSRTASVIARMCSGVVPQQPPTRLSQPFSAHFRSLGASVWGRSGKPVADTGSGKPTFGYAP